MKVKKTVKFFTLALMIVLAVFAFCACRGEVGIKSASINEDGELVITYTDGRSENLGIVVGKDGENGTDGNDGTIKVSEDGNAIALASAKGLISAVRVECGFTKTVQSFFGPNTYSYLSRGAGVIYKLNKSEGEAFIITNYHVVYDVDSNSSDGVSENISVYLYGSENSSQAIKAEYVGGSLYYDIAVLHVKGSDIIKNSDAAAVSVKDSASVTVGDRAIAVGNPEGMGISASLGIISVGSEYITMTAADGISTVSARVMRIDTAVNSGNSGGGLYSSEGELIGIVNAKISDTSVENIAYAIPSSVATSVADNIIDYCYGKDAKTAKRVMTGLGLVSANSRADYDEATGEITLSEVVGVYAVEEGSMADGLFELNDIIKSIAHNGKITEITMRHQVFDLMLDVKAGDTLVFTVERGGATLPIEIVITDAYMQSY